MDKDAIKNDLTLMLQMAERAGAKFRKAGKGFASHCPIHGGDNPTAFKVWRGEDGVALYRCWTRSECGRGDIYKLVMTLNHCDFKTAHEILGGDESKMTPARHETPIQLPTNPPPDVWQARARQLIERAESALWDERGREALAWLHARGLNDETIRAARLGYIPKNANPMKAESWGNPRESAEPIYFWESVLIPGMMGGKVWYLKMRLLHPKSPTDKFRSIRGSESASLYLADSIMPGKPAVFCEGELDALLLRQEVGDLASVMTLGSATNELNLAAWGLYLLRPSRFLLAYDIDKAGRQGKEKLTWLHDSQALSVPALRPGDKDLTDFHRSGGNLKSLIESSIQEDTPIFVNWLAGINPATIHGQYWRNDDGRIEAYYLPAELSQCLDAMQTIEA